SPVKPLTRTPSVRWAKRFACAIRSTGSSSPGSHAWCAAGRRRTLITFGLSSLARWAAGSVTSSQSHCVASITVIFTARVTRLDGGVSSPSILYQSRSSYGSTRGSMARPSRSAEAPSLGLQPQRERPSKGPAGTTLDPGVGAGSSACNCRWRPKPMTSFQTPKLANGGHGEMHRHGLTAETVVVALEDIEDYQAFRRAQKTDIRAHVKHRRSFSETPLPLLESSQRPQEIDSSKRRPIYVCEIELAEHTLP